ncbi:MAG: helix-turn-helix transcriptional regulator [Aliivibrio sp.]|uniref:helix-turn-helix domain-containing protein n=1 Tax=Aliivibrio sp. TaxID=1872443 RepID=UPI001A50F3E9|nr:helix-turn-helix transcriptional regulator [Aliivibrio sp.]
MDDRLSQEVCAILKKELRKCHISYRHLAAELEISEVSIKRLLNNTQPLSMQRLISITRLINFPLSKLLEEAETNIYTVPIFTKEQDQAFFDHPPLFSFWTELTEHQTVNEIVAKHGLNEASAHRYLRQLETLNLIELKINNGCKLLVPTHTSFEKGSKFPIFFTKQVLNGLQERVIDLPAEDNQACLITLKAELTHEEFVEITHKLDDWMFNKLRESQDLRAREGLTVEPYTFGFMCAKGAFHGKLPAIPNLTDD